MLPPILNLLSRGVVAMRLLKLLLAVALTGAALASPAYAVSVIDIYACYACQNTGNAAIDAALTANPSVAADGLLFAFANLSASPVTNAVFSVNNANPNDSFDIGTIGAGATVIVMPGLSDDSGVHPAGGLFSHTGSTMDTSDGDGGVSDASMFSFAGLVGSTAVVSGNIVPGEPSLIMPWRSPAGAGMTSFIGLGPNGDAGCTNCYFAKIGSVAAVPEPNAVVFLVAALGLMIMEISRKKR